MMEDNRGRYDNDTATACFRVEDIEAASTLWAEATAGLDDRIREKLGRYLRDNFPAAIIAEYFGAKSARVNFEDIENDLEVVADVAQKISALKIAIEKRSERACVGMNDEGEALRANLLFAAEHLKSAELAIEQADLELETARSYGDGIEVRGRGGATRFFREDPAENMGIKLGSLWLSQGLSLFGGLSGDGLDNVLFHVIMAADGNALSRRKDVCRNENDKWLRRLMTKVRKALREQSLLRT